MPIPLRPMIAMRSPRLTLSVTPSRITRLPNALRAPSDAEHVAPAGLGDVEPDVRPNQARALGALGLDDLFELLDLLEAPLGLLALGRVRAEALHEVLELADLLLGVLRQGLGALLVLVLGGDELGVVARVDGDGPVVDVGHVRGHRVQEVAVVRHDEQRAR